MRNEEQAWHQANQGKKKEQKTELAERTQVCVWAVD
jgi:hypothetical protein